MSRLRKGGLLPASSKEKKTKKVARKKFGFGKGKSFRLARKADRPVMTPLIGFKPLFKETLLLIKENWKVYTGLGLIYAFAYRLFIEGITRLDFGQLQEAIRGGSAIKDKVLETTILTTAAFDTAGKTSETQDSFYASLLTIIMGLCIIWATRQLMAKRDVRIRDALYNGPGPLLPTLTLIFVIFLQVLPMTIGAFLYSTATGSGLVQGGVESMVLFLVLLGSSLLTFYWLSSSLIALMLATLPGMYPWVALQEAKEMVTYRRWHLFHRLLSFCIVVVLAWLVVVVITVSNPLTVTIAAEIIGLMRAATLVLSLVFVYKLYRALVASSAEDE